MHRRTFLRGVGVTLALPWLEAMESRARGASGAKQPQRYAFIYTPNWYNQQTFAPKITGADWELTPALEPLGGLRKEITLCTGLNRTFVSGTGVLRSAELASSRARRQQRRSMAAFPRIRPSRGKSGVRPRCRRSN